MVDGPTFFRVSYVDLKMWQSVSRHALPLALEHVS